MSQRTRQYSKKGTKCAAVSIFSFWLTQAVEIRAVLRRTLNYKQNNIDDSKFNRNRILQRRIASKRCIMEELSNPFVLVLAFIHLLSSSAINSARICVNSVICRLLETNTPCCNPNTYFEFDIISWRCLLLNFQREK